MSGPEWAFLGSALLFLGTLATAIFAYIGKRKETDEKSDNDNETLGTQLRDELRKDNKQLQEANDILIEAKEKLSEANAKLQDTVAACERDKAVVIQQNERLLNENKELKVTIAAQNQRIKDLEETMSDLNIQMHKMKQP